MITSLKWGKGCVKCTKIMLWAFLPSVRNTVHVTHSFSGRIWRTSGILCMLCGLFAESTAAFVFYIGSISNFPQAFAM